MTTFAIDLFRGMLTWLFLVYTVVAVTHYLFQLRFAHFTYRRQRSPAFEEEFPDLSVPVDIIIPVFNEEPGLLEACIRSALQQDHPGGVRVIVVDDGSPNRARIEPVYAAATKAGAIVIGSARNVGKRRAQALALPRCTGELVVTLDSDSVLAPDAVRRLTRQFRDPKVGAATGFVDVANIRANLLTRVQRIRYWMAFNQERAAQTRFRTVMCCSGPLAAYRLEVLRSVAEDYLGQRYGGVECTYGDDRHLTNLILGAGYDTVFDAGAVAYTNVPERLRQFLKQQLRWNKSFYRELIWTMPYIATRPWYSRFDLACQVGMPMMLTITAGTALLVGMMSSPLYLLRYLALVALAAFIRASYAAYRERDPRFYLFILYGYVSAFLLMSVRLVALSTLADGRWGTRGGEAQRDAGWARRFQARPMVGSAAGVGAVAPAMTPGPPPTITRTPPTLDPPAITPALPATTPRVIPTADLFGSAWRAGLTTSHMSMARPAGAITPLMGAAAQPATVMSFEPGYAGPCRNCGFEPAGAARFCRRCGVPRSASPGVSDLD